jgi:hypothetical protein
MRLALRREEAPEGNVVRTFTDSLYCTRELVVTRDTDEGICTEYLACCSNAAIGLSQVHTGTDSRCKLDVVIDDQRDTVSAAK